MSVDLVEDFKEGDIENFVYYMASLKARFDSLKEKSGFDPIMMITIPPQTYTIVE